VFHRGIAKTLKSAFLMKNRAMMLASGRRQNHKNQAENPYRNRLSMQGIGVIRPPVNM
jgi:hypothetical protein